MTAPVARWLPVPEWERYYEVSDLGQVRSLDRVIVDALGRPFKHRGQLLRPTLNTGGYPSVSLTRNGKGHSRPVHTLVMITFVGPLPDGLEIRHLDGDHGNAALTNLVHGTRAENCQDRVRHGTHPNTRKTHCLRKHPLAGTNLSFRSGHRRCVACVTARRLVHQAAARGVNLDLQAEADRCYAELTREAS